MTDARLAAMKAAARAEFQAALRGRGTDPACFELIVHIDELVGPDGIRSRAGGETRLAAADVQRVAQAELSMAPANVRRVWEDLTRPK